MSAALTWTPGPAGDIDIDDEALAVEAIRAGRAGYTHSLPPKPVQGERRSLALTVLTDAEMEAILPRPITRADCANVPRPCPFVSCSAHLYIDVNPESGTLKLNHPHLEVWEMTETCSLDLADRGGMTLEEVGGASGVTRERTRQIEEAAIAKIRRSAPELAVPGGTTTASPPMPRGFG